MKITALRERLHEYIDNADERHLAAIYTLVEDQIQPVQADIYDEQTMAMLYQRREDHRNGHSKSYTVEEAFEIVRSRKAK